MFERYIDEYMGSKFLIELTHEFVKDYWKFRLGYWHRDENAKRIEFNERRLANDGNKTKAKRVHAKSLISSNIENQ